MYAKVLDSIGVGLLHLELRYFVTGNWWTTKQKDVIGIFQEISREILFRKDNFVHCWYANNWHWNIHTMLKWAWLLNENLNLTFMKYIFSVGSDDALMLRPSYCKLWKNKDGRPRKHSQHTKGNKLWEFIRDALKDPTTCPSVVR